MNTVSKINKNTQTYR